MACASALAFLPNVRTAPTMEMFNQIQHGELLSPFDGSFISCLQQVHSLAFEYNRYIDVEPREMKTREAKFNLITFETSDAIIRVDFTSSVNGDIFKSYIRHGDIQREFVDNACLVLSPDYKQIKLTFYADPE